MSFKRNQKQSLMQRQEESDRIKDKYPDRIPVIYEMDLYNQNAVSLKKTKYLVPNSLTIGQFVYVLRKQMTLKPEEAVFLTINNTLPPTSATMSQVYKEHKDPDGFLYFSVTRENTYG